LFSAKAGQEGEGGVTGVDSVLIFLLSSGECSLLGGNESLLVINFGRESAELSSGLLDMTLSCT